MEREGVLENKLQRSTGKLKGVIRERRRDWGEVNGRVVGGADGGGGGGGGGGGEVEDDDVGGLRARNGKSLRRRMRKGGKGEGEGRGGLGLGDGEMDFEDEDRDEDDGQGGGEWVDEDHEVGEEKGDVKRSGEETVIGNGNVEGTDRIATGKVEQEGGGAPAHQGDDADIEEIL